MATIKFVALTSGEYAACLLLQTDPVKRDKLQQAGLNPHARRSGDKLYVPAYLIDGVRLEPVENWP